MGWATPATTWALVTTSPGATTNPEPSWRTPQPAPTIWTVDRSALRTAARTARLLGNVTSGAASGGRPAKTMGNPSESRNDSIREKTDGTGGSTLSKACRMRDFCRAASSVVYRLLARKLPTSQAATKVATTATATPAAESTDPRRSRRRALAERAPKSRPTPPRRKAAPNTTTMAMRLRASFPLASPTSAGASRAPRNRPSQNPPKERTCDAAPSRSPWIPDTATMTSSRMSIQFMAGDPSAPRRVPCEDGPAWSAMRRGPSILTDCTPMTDDAPGEDGGGATSPPPEPRSPPPAFPLPPAYPPGPRRPGPYPPPPAWGSPSGPESEMGHSSLPRERAGPVDVLGRPMAKWWQRLVAFVIDLLILAVPNSIIISVIAGNELSAGVSGPSVGPTVWEAIGVALVVSLG